MARARWLHILLLVAAIAAFGTRAVSCRAWRRGVLFLSPAIVLLASLLTGRYVGEEHLARLAGAYPAARAAGATARRRAPPRPCAAARSCRAAGASSRPRWRSARRRAPGRALAPTPGPRPAAAATVRRVTCANAAGGPKIMRVPLRPAAFAVAATAALALTAPALGHETVTDRGVAVTLHVLPDDEPTAGQPATIVAVKVRPPKGGRFTFSSCACRVKVADADRHASCSTSAPASARRSLPQTPPPTRSRTRAATARRPARRKRFSAAFAIRAY